MTDITAYKAIMASFFTPPLVADTLCESAVLLERRRLPVRTAQARARKALEEMLQLRAVECHPDGTLFLHKERYPTALRKVVCRPLDDFDFREVGSGLYKPLCEFPVALQQLFAKAIENKDLCAHTVDGKLAVPDGVYLPFLDEHARNPFAPFYLFADHPIADDVADGSIKTVIRWGVPMISWSDYAPYSPCGVAPEDWNDLEVRTSFGLS